MSKLDTWIKQGNQLLRWQTQLETGTNFRRGDLWNAMERFGEAERAEMLKEINKDSEGKPWNMETMRECGRIAAAIPADQRNIDTTWDEYKSLVERLSDA